MRKTLIISAAVVAVLSFSSLSYADDAAGGAAAGATAGGITGAVVGGPVGAAVGAGVGATIGAASADSDHRDREKVYIEERAPRSRETTCVTNSYGDKTCTEVRE